MRAVACRAVAIGAQRQLFGAAGWSLRADCRCRINTLSSNRSWRNHDRHCVANAWNRSDGRCNRIVSQRTGRNANNKYSGQPEPRNQGSRRGFCEHSSVLHDLSLSGRTAARPLPTQLEPDPFTARKTAQKQILPGIVRVWRQTCLFAVISAAVRDKTTQRILE